MIDIRLVNKHDLKSIASIYKKAYNSLNIGENWSDKDVRSFSLQD